MLRLIAPEAECAKRNSAECAKRNSAECAKRIRPSFGNVIFFTSTFMMNSTSSFHGENDVGLRMVKSHSPFCYNVGKSIGGANTRAPKIENVKAKIRDDRRKPSHSGASLFSQNILRK